MVQTRTARAGGHLVVESLEALGADAVFGLPGIHALGIWEALRTSRLRSIAFRSELNAGFAADGYARVSGRPAPLVLSTGPGALISLATLMEAASSHVPVVAVASQIPSELVGRGRGYLHELPDQLASFAPVVKWAARASSSDEIPDLLAEAWRRSLTPPTGPVFVEVPVDFLTGEASLPPVAELDGTPETPPLPSESDLAEVARILTEAERPVVWAGGGVLRAGAWDGLARACRAARRAGGDDVHGQGRVPGGSPAVRRLGVLRPEAAPGAGERGRRFSAWAPSSGRRRPTTTRSPRPAASSRSTQRPSGSAPRIRPSGSSATLDRSSRRYSPCSSRAPDDGAEPGRLGAGSTSRTASPQPASTSSSACSGRSGLPCRAMPSTRGT